MKPADISEAATGMSSVKKTFFLARSPYVDVG